MNVHYLIQNGHTKEAIELLSKTNQEAVLLQGQFASLERDNRMGLLNHQEYNVSRNRIVAAVLQLAGNTTVVVNHNYITFLTSEDRPGNELALFNKIYRALEKMVEDQDYPLDEIEVAVRTMHKYLPMDDYIDVLGDFKKDRYLQATPPMKTKARREFAQMLLDTKRANLDVIRQAVTEVQNETTWQQAWTGLLENPTKNRWDQTRRLIDKRLTNGIFTDAQRSQWTDVSGDVDDIEDGMFWKIKFNRSLPDLKDWVTSNLR